MNWARSTRVARDVVKAEEIVDFTRRENSPERIAKRRRRDDRARRIGRDLQLHATAPRLR